MVFLGTFAYIIGFDCYRYRLCLGIRASDSLDALKALRTRQNTAQFVMLPVFLPTDFVAWGFSSSSYWPSVMFADRRNWHAAGAWFCEASAAASAAVLAIFLLTALMDSIHWRDALPPADASDAASAVQAYSGGEVPLML